MGQWMDDYTDMKDSEPWPPHSKTAALEKALSLKERIRLAKEHMDRSGQRYDTLWPYQSFALNIGELLDAAEREA